MRLPIALIALVGVLAAAPLAAQNPQVAPPIHVQPGQLAPQQKPKPQAKFQVQKPLRVQANEVLLPVTVRDPHGNLALDLGPEDFQIYDDGNLQQIVHFGLGGSAMDVVLVVESSSRIQPLMAGIRQSGIVFSQTVMGGNGQAAILSVDGSSHLLVPFTYDQDRIEKAISHLQVGDDGLRLYDALGRAIQMLEEQPPTRRRVIVVLSEAVDSGSVEKLESVLRDAELANISIYTIGLSTTAAEMRSPPSGYYSEPQFGPPGTFPHPGPPGAPQTPDTMAATEGNANLLALVETLAKLGIHLITPEALVAASVATGGAHISTFHDKSIQRAMNRVGDDLHAEYMIAYNAPQDGPWGFHRVTVRVMRPGYRVRTRPGYFLAMPNGTTTGGGTP
jgi:VWFA-related protein